MCSDPLLALVYSRAYAEQNSILAGVCVSAVCHDCWLMGSMMPACLLLAGAAGCYSCMIHGQTLPLHMHCPIQHHHVNGNWIMPGLPRFCAGPCLMPSLLQGYVPPRQGASICRSQPWACASTQELIPRAHTCPFGTPSSLGSCRFAWTTIYSVQHHPSS